MRSWNPDGGAWGEVKFIFTDAQSGEDFRIDLMYRPWNAIRLTIGTFVVFHPLCFELNQPLTLKAELDDFQLSLWIDDMPIFRKFSLGRRGNGWIGVGTFNTTAHFEEFSYNQFEHIELDPEIDSVHSKIEQFTTENLYQNNIFVMMRFDKNLPRLREIYGEIQRTLDDYGLIPHLANDAYLDRYLWTNVRIYMNSCKYGLAVLENISRSSKKPDQAEKEWQPANPNIALEIGYMLRSNKRCLLLKDEEFKIQTDLIGHLYRGFRADDLQTVRDAVEEWCERDLRLSRKPEG